ncbi:MAG: hypothetical protein NVS3B20_11760 [Polyangiales bacterium]
MQQRTTVPRNPSREFLSLGFLDRRIITAALRSAHGQIRDAAQLLGVGTLDLLMLLAEEPQLLDMAMAEKSETSVSGIRKRVDDGGKDNGSE